MVINSILENDLYKFSMSYYYQAHYPNAWGAFTFHDRNNTVFPDVNRLRTLWRVGKHSCGV